jgi:hypothetical protein
MEGQLFLQAEGQQSLKLAGQQSSDWLRVGAVLNTKESVRVWDCDRDLRDRAPETKASDLCYWIWEWAWRVHEVWLRDPDFNWDLNRDIDGHLHRYLNGIGLRDRYPPVDVHGVRPVYWNFHSDGIRDRDSYFYRVGTFHRDWHFKWHSFNDRDRSVHDNWIRMIDRDFNLNGVGFRDSNWDSDRVRLGLRDGYRDLDRVRVVDTDWDFHRIGSVNGNPDFNREWVRDRDLLQHGIGPVYRDRDLLQHRIGLGDFHSLLDDLFARVEAAVAQPVAMDGKTTLRGAALLDRVL